MVVASRARQRACLPRVEKIADDQRNGYAGQYPPIQQLGGKAQHVRPQRRDEQHLDEVVEGETEEAVDISAHEKARSKVGGGWFGIHHKSFGRASRVCVAQWRVGRGPQGRIL